MRVLGGRCNNREIIGSGVLSTASKGHALYWPPPDRSQTGFITGPLIKIDENSILRQNNEARVSTCKRQEHVGNARDNPNYNFHQSHALRVSRVG